MTSCRHWLLASADAMPMPISHKVHARKHFSYRLRAAASRYDIACRQHYYHHLFDGFKPYYGFQRSATRVASRRPDLPICRTDSAMHASRIIGIGRSGRECRASTKAANTAESALHLQNAPLDAGRRRITHYCARPLYFITEMRPLSHATTLERFQYFHTAHYFLVKMNAHFHAATLFLLATGHADDI